MFPALFARVSRIASGVRVALFTIHMYRRCDTPVKPQSGIPTNARYTCIVSRRMTEDHDRDEMQKLLAYANFSKVAEAVGVKRAAVANWAAGRHVTPARLEQVRALYGLPVTPEGQQKETPRPEWAEGLADDVAMKLAALLGGPEYPAALELLRERLEGTPLPPPEAHGGEGEAQGPGAGAPRVRRVG